MSTAELTAFARDRLQALLEQWWRVAPAPDGLLQPAHGPDWGRSEDRRRSLVSQARFAHNFTKGWLLTGDRRWRERAQLAARGLQSGFPLAPCGLPFFSVNESGTVADERVWTYGVSFALFGFAHGAVVEDDPVWEATAESYWRSLVKLRDGHGGWSRHYSPDGRPVSEERTHNPIMHLFEALLAWHRLGRNPVWTERAREILDFICSRVLAPSGDWMPEQSDAQWRPAAMEGWDYLSIGHQWEWAHLLVQAHEAGVPGIDLDLARRLAATGRRLGLRGPDDLVSRVKPDGSVVADWHLYWDYCEAARACVWLTAKRVAPGYEALLPGLMRGLETRCYDSCHGGYATRGDRPAETSPKGDMWRVDYHQIGLFADLIELAPALHAAIGSVKS